MLDPDMIRIKRHSVFLLLPHCIRLYKNMQTFCVRSSSSVQCSYRGGGFIPQSSMQETTALPDSDLDFLETEQCQQQTTFHTHKRQVCETDCHKSAGNTFQMLRESVITEHDTSVITEG